jgi:D-alanyl-lipoteichoic acid acyltransferase DltB (MBOAT superfamily)
LWLTTGYAISVPEFHLLLPVGISFYTFMAVGYMVDIYKGKYLPESNLLDYSLFIGFFPQIASGPIGRGNQLIPQFKVKQKLLYDNISDGMKMVIWGFFMKLVVGDRAGIYVDTVFGNYAYHNGVSLMIATFMYTIQIYCDFAGYSLIAIGVAKTMGYNLMENFRRPYFAVSVADFWRRWHISLSTWFRDYVYIPCGGSRVGKIKLYRNLLITFLVSGLWHGAAYNFVLWGVSCGKSNIC